jgi:hypothetical protein
MSSKQEMGVLTVSAKVSTEMKSLLVNVSSSELATRRAMLKRNPVIEPEVSTSSTTSLLQVTAEMYHGCILQS